MALGKETTQGKGGWFPSIIGANDQGPRVKGLPRSGGKPTIVPCTTSYDADTIPAFPDQPGGIYTET